MGLHTKAARQRTSSRCVFCRVHGAMVFHDTITWVETDGSNSRQLKVLSALSATSIARLLDEKGVERVCTEGEESAPTPRASLTVRAWLTRFASPPILAYLAPPVLLDLMVRGCVQLVCLQVPRPRGLHAAARQFFQHVLTGLLREDVDIFIFGLEVFNWKCRVESVSFLK